MAEPLADGRWRGVMLVWIGRLTPDPGGMILLLGRSLGTTDVASVTCLDACLQHDTGQAQVKQYEWPLHYINTIQYELQVCDI